MNLLLADLFGWLEDVSTAPDLRRAIIDTTTSWLDDPTMSQYRTDNPPISSQLTIGWSHFMFGRISCDITEYQHQYYLSIGSRREAQSWTHQLILKLWTTVIRPIWQYRNNFVHDLEPQTTTRLYSDIKQEARELFFSTNPDSLLADDRHLLLLPASAILSRP